MHKTDSYQDGYCLLSQAFDTTLKWDPLYKRMHEIIPYCLRLLSNDNNIAEFTLQNTVDANFTFADLKKKNITSQMLLSWSASIDLAEQYEIFLNDNSNSTTEKKVLFYNCTSPWFGPYCRFAFGTDTSRSFEDIAKVFTRSKWPVAENINTTCYEHLHCQTILSCLDWREICDGKSDCLDSSDEKHCWKLEVNSCEDHEFRCHNGLCIPIEFSRDVVLWPDCLDRTDEFLSNFDSSKCYLDPTFRCEEHTCGPGIRGFSCGDGQCTNGVEPCYNGRSHLLPDNLCAKARYCFSRLQQQIDSYWCDQFCTEKSCVTDYCTNLYDSLFIPVIFGHVRLVYVEKPLKFTDFILPDYVCYDENLCEDFLPAKEYFNNLTCGRLDNLILKPIQSSDRLKDLVINVLTRFRSCLVIVNETMHCNYSIMYQCQNSSKCISKQRLLDGLQDCPYNDDETYNESCSLSDIRQRLKIPVNGIEKCFASLFEENENDREYRLMKTHINFQLICDDETELLPVLINERNETDETNCEQWECNNTYSRCDKLWLCGNGADEVNCSPSTCPQHHHDCVFLNDTSKVSCLPITQVNNGIVDCLGGTDERKKFPRKFHIPYYFSYAFRCWNDTQYFSNEKLCNKENDCQFNDDEIFCSNFALESNNICDGKRSLTKIEEFFCNFTRLASRPKQIDFILTNIKYYPMKLNMDNLSLTILSQTKAISAHEHWSDKIVSDELWLCNRGIPILVHMNNDTSKLHCLCPPSYYGNKCQFQNQRVSLTIQIQLSSDWRKVFIFIITLIDDEGNIESHDHIEYLAIRDCIAKYNIYLLYSTRPKNPLKNYSVQIDAFNQWTMTYRASWIFPLQFSFLPVHRLSVLLKVSLSNMKPTDNCSPSCIHGQCFKYINNQNLMFCRCESGWSGIRCDIKYTCNCAIGSVCVSNSICLCRQNRYGPRCGLLQLSCQNNSCMNNGQCVPRDERYTFIYPQKFVCICPEGYTGIYCGLLEKRTRIDISFHHKLTIPFSLLIHLISVRKEGQPIRTSVMKKIGFDEYSLILYTTVEFNIAIAQIINDYYIIVLHEQTITFANITTQIIPSYRCRSIVELFNSTFAEQHLLIRIKYYHLPCQKDSKLVCFYDKIYFCLCTLDRTANCFEFNHNTTYDCQGYNICENDGHCFQANDQCPTSFCVCHQCYFGSRCQFTTKRSILSLDIILGYHIRSKTAIQQQPSIVKVAVALFIIIIGFGVINIFLSLITFREKETQNVGCGLYLFTSSIISMTIILVFTLKFSFLLASQIGSINNRTFLCIQCISMDFLIRCLLVIHDWLSACIAIERAVNVSQGIKFNKIKSRQMAKWTILIVILFSVCTYIYVPFYYRVIDDEDEERTWCVSQYSSSLQVFDWSLNIFHFSLPFIINCISALIVIINTARIRSNSQQKESFKEHFHKQFRQHKHLLISPLILFLLALPRLIISFLSGCMESARDSWLYLFGYFISFVPSMMTFVIFVLPSDAYKKEFTKSIKRIFQQ